jgi:hypothetical protein
MVWILGVWVLGCPPAVNDSDPETDSTEADADTDADMDSDSDTDSDTDTDTHALLTTSDGASGALVQVALQRGDVTTLQDPFAADARLYGQGRMVYAVSQDLLLGIETAAPETAAFERSVSGAPDAAVWCQSQVFLSFSETGSLLAFHAETGEPGRTVDLSAFADADGSAEPREMVRVGGAVYVALHQLDQASPDAPAGDGTVVGVSCNLAEVSGSWSVGPRPALRPHLGEQVSLLVRTGQRAEGSFDGQVAVFDHGHSTLSEPVFQEDGVRLQSLEIGPTGRGVAVTHADGVATAWCVDPDDWSMTELLRTDNPLDALGISNGGVAVLAEHVEGGGQVYRADLTACAPGSPSVLSAPATSAVFH